MNPIAASQLLDALKWRYATKAFDPARKIAPELWASLEESLVLTPSSFGIQPWKFQIVVDPALREQLVPASWGQSQPKDCSHFVVFTVKTGLGEPEVDRYIARTAEVRGTTADALAPFKKVMMGSLGKAAAVGTLDTWQTHQLYIALGQFMAAAALLGVDTCPMEGIVPAKYDEILGLAGSGYQTVVACAAGYRSATDKYATTPKVRFKADDVIVQR
jgi:nitroreductase